MVKWEGKDKLLFKIDRLKIEIRWPGSVLNIELNMKLNECSQKIFQKVRKEGPDPLGILKLEPLPQYLQAKSVNSLP